MALGSDQGSIIVDSAAISTDAVPDRLVGREEQADRLWACLAPMPAGQAPLNAWLCGPPGSGKSSLARMSVDQACSSRASSVGVYVNCWQHRTLYSVLQAMTNQLRVLGADAQDTDVKLNRIRQTLRGRPAVIILDEVDRPLPAQRNDILYGLLGLPNVGLLCAASSTNALATLDKRVRSRLSPVVVELARYFANELEAVLIDRAERALAPGVGRAASFGVSPSRPGETPGWPSTPFARQPYWQSNGHNHSSTQGPSNRCLVDGGPSIKRGGWPVCRNTRGSSTVWPASMDRLARPN